MEKFSKSEQKVFVIVNEGNQLFCATSNPQCAVMIKWLKKATAVCASDVIMFALSSNRFQMVLRTNMKPFLPLGKLPH